MRARALAVLAVLVLPALVAAGCGGGGSPTTPADAFRQKADDICREAQKDLKAIGQPDRPSEFAGYLRRSLLAAAPSLDQLKALTPPPELKALHARWIAEQTRQRASLSALQAQLETGADPQKTLEAATPGINRRADAINATAKRLGLKVCGTT